MKLQGEEIFVKGNLNNMFNLTIRITKTIKQNLFFIFIYICSLLIHLKFFRFQNDNNHNTMAWMKIFFVIICDRRGSP